MSESVIRFIYFKKGNLVTSRVDLPPGAIEDGKISDVENFKTALNTLHSQIVGKSKKKVYAVVNIPDVNVYTQVFSLPSVAENSLEGAVKLNLQMISPSDFSSVYSDWQRIGESGDRGRQIEILGSFIQRKLVNELTRALTETNFVVVAVEFYSLAISRLIAASQKTKDILILLYLNSGGLGFAIIKEENLYFQHFINWPPLEKKEITIDVLREIIVREVQKILNFSAKNWPQKVEKLLLITPALEDKVSQLISENFSMTVQKLSLPNQLKKPDDYWSLEDEGLSSLHSDWFGALGSAARGLIPRSRDIIISLASTGTEEEFSHYQLISFINFWRNMIVTSMIFLIVVFGGTDVFLSRSVNDLNARLSNLVNLPSVDEVNELQEKAKDFNSKVDMALSVREKKFDWSSLIGKISDLAGSDIMIDRIFIQSPNVPILFNGKASSERAIIDFKNKIDNSSIFKNSNLPLASVTPSGSGLLSFSLSFELAAPGN